MIESQDEIAEMKRKFKIMTRQIEQLKEEIQTKDQSLVKEHFEHMKIGKEKEALKDGLQVPFRHSISDAISMNLWLLFRSSFPALG